MQRKIYERPGDKAEPMNYVLVFQRAIWLRIINSLYVLVRDLSPLVHIPSRLTFRNEIARLFIPTRGQRSFEAHNGKHDRDGTQAFKTVNAIMELPRSNVSGSTGIGLGPNPRQLYFDVMTQHSQS